ncbi:MAG: tetratricopeptide repeat protein [Cyanobacteria bacterium SZAS LIN-2]|nr:tetratricopeptide repeat protein [Cyanobacteria bacterium SZAS LIN-3]MBS1996360.1 tetratricopeptide repeat protein [Cyanobacteria bacterium SZAS LIN-2]MBS2005546.1 tetratricopeptide repeat protein [Cyanobacteria bacterium SZAS TMP-1]
MPENWELFKICAENAALKGDYARAENFMWEAMEEAAKTQSLLKVALCMDYLGDLYLKLGKFSDAEQIFNECLNKQIEVLGIEHPELASVLNKLSSAQAFQNKLKEAEDSLKQALLIHLIAYGSNHPHTRWTMKNMEAIYVRQGKQFDISEISGWGGVPAAAQPTAPLEQLICKTCHKPYSGPQCANCTQMRLVALPSFEVELERINVVCATRDIRAGSIIVLGSVHMDIRMVAKSECFQNIKSVLGRSARRLLREGQALKPADLEDV